MSRRRPGQLETEIMTVLGAADRPLTPGEVRDLLDPLGDWLRGRHRKSHGADPATGPHPARQPSAGTVRRTRSILGPEETDMRARIGATVAVIAAVVSIVGGLAAPLYAVFGAN